MELGPLQKEWVQYLRDNGHLQGSTHLGKKNIETGEIIQLCCLGAAELLICKNEGREPKWHDRGLLCSIGTNGISSTAVLNIPDRIGLKSTNGGIILTLSGKLQYLAMYKNKPYTSLADLNDVGMPWSDIADIIEQNVDKLFSRSV